MHSPIEAGRSITGFQLDSTHTQANSALAFLSILEIPELGFCGGLLLLNRNGRPLEFHCTLPIKADRAQQILYGSSLRKFLFSELIGPSLVNKTKQPPRMLLVDSVETLPIRKSLSFPVAYLSHITLTDPRRENQQSTEPQAPSVATQAAAKWLCKPLLAPPQRETRQLCLDSHSGFFQVQYLAVDDRDPIEQLIQGLPNDFILDEPFQRIIEAIEEAHSVAL